MSGADRARADAEGWDARTSGATWHDRLRRVRDRIDREYAQPLDVEALARGAHMSAGHLSREFRLDRSGIEKRRPPRRT